MQHNNTLFCLKTLNPGKKHQLYTSIIDIDDVFSVGHIDLEDKEVI